MNLTDKQKKALEETSDIFGATNEHVNGYFINAYKGIETITGESTIMDKAQLDAAIFNHIVEYGKEPGLIIISNNCYAHLFNSNDIDKIPRR